MFPVRATVLSLLALLPAASAGSERPPDVVVLEDGTRLLGRVIHEDGDRIVLRTGSRERTIRRSEIESAHTRLSTWREAMERWRLLDKENPTKIADIGTFTKRMGLPEETRVFALRAIAIDPNHRIARDLLGHERKEGDRDWTLKELGRRWTWNERVEGSFAFGDAWELETTHWKLRTNLPLLEATNAILDLENVYSIFYAVIAPEVGSYHLDEPLSAQIHADSASFPEVASSRGFYDRVGHVLLVDAEGGLDRGLLVHEAIHQLIEATAVRTRGGKGEIAAWLDEGLAEYFRATTRGAPGRVAYDARGLDLDALRTHAGSNEPYKLSRLLVFDAREYQATSRQDLKYAQSYTFVQFLFEGEDGRYRRPFFRFLRGAWDGRGSSTDLEGVLATKADALDKKWHEWVRDHAR